ncbi:MAG TPA: hypothetical protein PKK06_14730 [Phycisphaerae bacterium]|nr:hypothetical protein [Phycisphaerae bacterium]HNU46534.1 hypothetical protein [Phycisphaerae bacterium]
MSLIVRLLSTGRCGWLASVVVLSAAGLAVAAEPIIIGHTCTNLDQVPPYWIAQAKNLIRLSYGHTSHGSQIVTGITTLNNVLGCSCSSCSSPGCPTCTYGFCDDYYFYKYGGSNPVAPPGVLSFWDYKPEGASDLGNPNRTQWEVATRAMLQDPRYVNRNLVMWSWCGQADTTPENIQLYLNLMRGLEISYPNVTFVYMTGHLNGSGVEGNLNQRNNQIRAHCLAYNCVLFDFADIESYDPDGNYFLPLYADDGCNYSGGNWATQWCAAHPGSDLCASCSCAHSQPLNCNLKGRAFWWMMARVAGWDGTAHGDFDQDLDVDSADFALFSACLAGPQVPPAPAQSPPTVEQCLTVFDTNADGDVDLADFRAFQAAFTGSAG